MHDYAWYDPVEPDDDASDSDDDAPIRIHDEMQAFDRLWRLVRDAGHLEHITLDMFYDLACKTSSCSSLLCTPPPRKARGAASVRRVVSTRRDSPRHDMPPLSRILYAHYLYREIKTETQRLALFDGLTLQGFTGFVLGPQASP